MWIASAASLTERSERHTAELFEKATKALDPDDPTSPLARHRQAAQKEHDQLIKHLSEQHEDLKKTVVELTTTVRVQQEAAAARVKLASVTPLKGGTYEDKIHALVTQIAVGLGDEYRETGRLGGAIHGNNKKGDGVLTVEGGVARVVLEMSDSDRRDWNDYLVEAERNRAAQASIGLVPSKEQNGGQGVRALSPTRLVVAFDADVDDPSLLRTVIQLSRLAALTVAVRDTDGNLVEARGLLSEALGVVGKLDEIVKNAGAIRKQADKIDHTADTVRSLLTRLIGQAQSALTTRPETQMRAATNAQSGVA